MSDSSKEETNSMNLIKLALEKPAVMWSDIAGLGEAKEALREAVVLPIKQGKSSKWNTVLLHGVPGSGKTVLAKGLASEVEPFTYLSLSSTDICSKWLEESGEGNLSSLFEAARLRKPSVLFLDDVEFLFGTQAPTREREDLRATFIQQIQGLEDGMIVVAASATPWTLDASIRKSFKRSIYLPLPGPTVRKEIVHIQLKGVQHSLSEEDLKLLGKETGGYTAADICVLVRDAMMAPVRKIQNATHFKKVQLSTASEPGVPNDLLTPCSPSSPGAVKMSWMDLESDQLLEPVISMEDMLSSLKDSRPTVKDEELHVHENFRDEYGQDG